MKISELKFLPLVRRPGRYLGNELNTAGKDWDEVLLSFVLIFPDLYEIGMSHQGLQILYHILNAREDLLADRAYAPDLDMEAFLRQDGVPLFSLEARRPLREFDVIGFTLPYELCYTNILTILDLAHIPFLACERTDADPLIIGGGSASFNPEPVADFFDAILLGDGEEAVLEMATVIRSAREKGMARQDLLYALKDIDGVYVPSFFSPVYDGQGALVTVQPLHEGYETVQRRIVADIGKTTSFPPLVPLIKIVHDRMGIEVSRGCTRGCRFCQAGIIYRPVRERSADLVHRLACEGVAAGGFDEVSMLSLSTGDYSNLPEALGRLMDTFTSQYVSVSMPSMRVGSLTPEIMQQIKRVRKTGFTVAPEAGTERLRRVLNKDITEADLLTTCRDAFQLGWKLIKFYFMFGLPTETEDDIEGIVELAKKAMRAGGRGGTSITVSVATFVPKPHTPFQWEEQISIDQGLAIINFLKKKMPRKGFNLKWHDPYQGFLEGVFSRGDRRLAPVIVEAWQRGSRLDGWGEHFDLDRWHQAAAACNLDLDQYLRQRDIAEALPWQHLSTGVEKEYLVAEREKAFQEEQTGDCRFTGCTQCGVCDFKTIKPIIHRSEPALSESSAIGPDKAQDDSLKYSYRFTYTCLGDARFLGHLELMQVFFRAFRRMRLPIAFSQGFNPSPKVSFSPALPVGTESLDEFFDLVVLKPIVIFSELIDALNQNLPVGLEITAINPVPVQSSPPEVQQIAYRIGPLDMCGDALRGKIEDFMVRESVLLQRQRKGRTRQIDIRPMLISMEVQEEGHVLIILAGGEGVVTLRPREVLQEVFGLSNQEAMTAGILKLRQNGR